MVCHQSGLCHVLIQDTFVCSEESHDIGYF